MKIIVQVKEDNGVLAIRIPAPIRKQLEIKKGDYLILKVDKSGQIRVKNLKEELEYTHGVGASRDRFHR